MNLRNVLKRMMRSVSALIEFVRLLLPGVEAARQLAIDDYLMRHLFSNPKYADPKRLSRYAHQVFSQNGEDGIIEEIFRRIGAGSRSFVEIGVGDGTENNTAYLLASGWSGCWLEGDKRLVSRIQKQFAPLIEKGQLKVCQTWVAAETINSVLAPLVAGQQVDLLSIDIDGNDLWIWKAITVIHPRAVVMEYNAIFPPTSTWVMPYNAQHYTSGDSYYGASLGALTALGTELGYSLVGCDFHGVNAFFVRNDLLADLFLSPYDAHNHYEPPRYFLRRKVGPRRRVV